MTGDAIAGIANSPYTFKAISISGNLTVDPGVVIYFEGNYLTEGANKVGGTLTVGAGASLLCAMPLSWKYLAVAGQVTVNGTSAAPVLFSRSPLGTGNNNECHLNFGAATLRYARFSSTPLTVGAPSTIRDCTFEPIAGTGEMAWVAATSGQVASDVLFEFNRFAKVRIDGHGFTVRNSEFNGVSPGGANIEVCNDPGRGEACIGTRNTDAKVLIRDNVFQSPAGSELFGIGRAFSAIDVSGNFFAPALVPASQDAWDGTSTGCGDSLGSHGGPLVSSPQLTARPMVGPR